MVYKTRAVDQMIKTILMYDKSISRRVVYALRQVPRHKFIKEKTDGYSDTPLQIGFGQTISQPFIVAYMTDKLDIRPLHKVLEIGTGSGYQAAILAEMAYDIYSVERIFKLSQRTEKLLRELGYRNIKLKVGDGYNGWKENAPYDRIIVTATADVLIPPQALVDQLVEDGKMIIPMKRSGKSKVIPSTNIHATNTTTLKTIDVPYEELVLITKTGKTYTEKSLIGVRFVPLVNEV